MRIPFSRLRASPIVFLLPALLLLSVAAHADPPSAAPAASGGAKAYPFPYDLILQKPSSDSTDSAKAERARLERALQAIPRDPREIRSKGAVAVIAGGAFMIPIGLLGSLASSFGSCVGEDDGGIFTQGCERSGPNTAGEIAGIGVSLGGLVLIGIGIYNLSR